MDFKIMKVTLGLASCAMVFVLTGCSGQQTSNISNGNATPQARVEVQGNTSSEATPATPGAKGNSAAMSTGEAIDTSKYDAEIERFKNVAERKGGSGTAGVALAKAYAERGNALTQARQYRAALGDYRRALKYDPKNEAAEQGGAMIVMIMRQMGREVPPEGQEPAPLPFKPSTPASVDKNAPPTQDGTASPHRKF
jgi:tetratricopeptide (TPR) repeat protein